ncbi:MAG TPA: TonB-dependent receptor [Gemmatimonadaceae bacterium]|nr:TonB-dependent receptor [Gemmatimonadaceae bacterium]
MPIRPLVLGGALVCAAATLAHAQRGSLTGRVTDTLGTPVAGVTIHLANTHYGTVTNGAGQYRLDAVDAGPYTVTFHRLGYAPDSLRITVGDGFVNAPDEKLRSAAAELAGVTIVASSRLNETREAALARREQADNFIVVQSGDEIRSLPNANAAEALARMPGVSTERDEGEGKFVQIRGTEPRLSNVTINGAHVPGTESKDRIPKLDDVPSDLLGAVEVSETLTADQDADAIGGSVNLVSKIPDDVPRGYLALQGGMQSQLNAKQGQWSLMYGGRYGEQRKLGALLGVTFDRNNRSIEDVEPAWDMSGSRAFPVEWDQRDYIYGRTRTGAVGDLDYRFDGGSTLGLRGLFSEFHNYGSRYRFDAATAGDSTQADAGTSGVGTGATFVRETSQRRPNEQMYGMSMTGQIPTVPFSVSYGADFAGTRQLNKDYRTNDFEYDGPDGNGVPLQYDASSLITPRYRFVNASDSTAALDPKNYALSKYSLSDGSAIGHDVGAHLDALEHYTLGTMPSTLKLGLKLRDETKSYVSRARTFAPIGTVPLDQFLSSYSDPSFYTTIASGFLMGPQAAEGAIESYENAHPEAFTDKTNFAKDSLASYDGGEDVYSAYAMHTSDAGALHVNVGLRAEATRSHYTGHVATKNGSTTAISTTPGAQDYMDLFPSVQLKYALSDRSDFRVAVTRGIARPNYFDLAPHLSGTVCASCQHSFGNLSAGNPDLKPQHAWNFDVLAERYLTRGGLLSAALFYKKIAGFIYDREFVYDGPVADFQGYYGTRPENGGDATLEGSELTYTQKFYMLPGVLSGLGVDMNWTHTNSRAQILADTATSAAGLGSPAVARNTALPRQAPNVANLAATYDLGRLSARAAYQYQGESIFEYGDGSATPSGDTYLYAHGQVDASLSVALTPAAQLQIQGLDLNNEVFGFYNGIPKLRYNIQREVYGRSVIVGVKYGF